MRADLYTIALISALPEEHVFLSNTHAATFNVSDQAYGIYPVFTDDAPVFDKSGTDENGELTGPTDSELIESISTALKSGAEMIVVNRDLISAVRNELAPPPPEPPIYQTTFDPRDFLAMFPIEVQRAIFVAAESDVDLRIKLQMTTAGPVSVKHPDTIDVMAGLLQAGLVEQDLHDSVLQGKRLN